MVALLAGNGPGPILLSNATVHSETGDVTGIELTIEPATGGKVFATLRHFEGSCQAETVRLSGTWAKSRLKVSGGTREGQAVLEGTLRPKEFSGRLAYQLPGQTNEVTLRLRVIREHVICR